jgi:hypothetical protein
MLLECCATSPVFNTLIKTYSLYYQYYEQSPNVSSYSSPFYLYELGKEVAPDRQNYYLAQGNAIEWPGKTMLVGPGATADGKEVFSISYTKNTAKGRNCCWKVRNTNTNDRFLNISFGSALRSPVPQTNPISDMAASLGGPSSRLPYVNDDISIIYGGVNTNNESFFYMTFENANETLYLNGQQSLWQRDRAYASLGAIRNDTANQQKFEQSVRWVFTNKNLADFMLGNKTVAASDPTHASIQAVARNTGWLVESFENYVCTTRKAQSTHVNISMCTKACANYTYMTFYRGETSKFNCACTNTCERISPANYFIGKPAIYKRIPLVANWSIYDSDTVKSCDGHSHHTHAHSVHVCAQNCTAYAYMTFINYDKSSSGVAAPTCNCYNTCNLVSLTGYEQKQPVIYKSSVRALLATPSPGGNGTSALAASSSSSDSHFVMIAVLMTVFIVLLVILAIICSRCSDHHVVDHDEDEPPTQTRTDDSFLNFVTAAVCFAAVFKFMSIKNNANESAPSPKYTRLKKVIF